MPAYEEAPAPIQLAEVTELRRAAAEAVWLRLCADFLQDPECNRAADMARAAIDSQTIDGQARLCRVLGLPGPTFKFPRDFGFHGATSPRLIVGFLRHALFPAALEKVAQDVYGGLEHRRLAALRTEKELEEPAHPVDSGAEGLSDEEIRLEEIRLGGDFGVFQHGGLPHSPGFEDDLVAVPELHRRTLAEMAQLFQRLKATRRFTSKKHRKELRTVHRNLRRLVEHAYPVESDQDATTARVHEGSLRALGFLARVSRRREKPFSLAKDFKVISMEMTGKVMELAGLVTLRRKPNNARRYKRVSKALGRV